MPLKVYVRNHVDLFCPGVRQLTDCNFETVDTREYTEPAGESEYCFYPLPKPQKYNT